MSSLTPAYKINPELVDFLVSREELSDLLEHTPTLVENHIGSRVMLICLLTKYIYKRGLCNVFCSSRNLEYISHFLLNYLELNLQEEFSQVNSVNMDESDIIGVLESIIDSHANNIPSNLTFEEREIVLTLAKQKSPSEFDTDIVFNALSKVGLTPQTIVNGKKVINGQLIGADVDMLNDLSSTWDGLSVLGKIEDRKNFSFGKLPCIVTYNELNEEPQFDYIVDNELNALREYINTINN